jgi:hypothetical protein
MKIPIEIINKILIYVGELNDELYITQYHPITNKPYNKINHYADVLWGIQATITAKRIYPYSFHHVTWNITFPKMRELYSHLKPHYEGKLRNKELI